MYNHHHCTRDLNLDDLIPEKGCFVSITFTAKQSCFLLFDLTIKLSNYYMEIIRIRTLVTFTSLKISCWMK